MVPCVCNGPAGQGGGEVVTDEISEREIRALMWKVREEIRHDPTLRKVRRILVMAGYSREAIDEEVEKMRRLHAAGASHD